MARRFMDFCQDYSRHFIVRGKDVSDHARSYLSGLLGTQRRKNIERIGEDVAASNYQGMQQLITDSPWDHEALMDQIARDANGLLGGHRHSALYLDETSFVKKGCASVGVQRQYCGRLGKLENCQVGVFGCLGRGERAALIDARLFLPEEWSQDEERCAKAKVPPEHRVHQTKAELALLIVQRAKERGVSFGWIGGDEIYGNNRPLTDALEEMGELFLMDVNRNLHLYEADPCPRLKSERPGLRGRPVCRLEAGNARAQRCAAEELASKYFESESRLLTIRQSAKGPVRARLWVKKCWQWDGKSPTARPRLLVVREEEDGSFKYSLTNAPESTPAETLAYMQAQRFWIERAFQDAKSELGMAQYEVRSWRGWHHHMALVCLAMLFALRERLMAFEHTPLLSTRDVVELLAYYLPRRNRNEAEVLQSMQRRHIERARDIARNRRKTVRRVTKEN
jgi:SRSO17 transposase